MKFALSLLLVLSTALVGCAAPPPASEAAERAAAEATPPPAQQHRAPPMSDPYPPRQAKPAVVVDSSCTRNSDCKVKNVGNCCGMMPACVNKDSPTDPAAVQAQCQASGMMSICGFQDIKACQCVSGRCEAESSAVSGSTELR